MNLDTIYKILSIVNLILTISGLIATNLYWRSKEQMTKVALEFKKISDKQEEFEDYLSELTGIESEASNQQRQKIFTKTYSRYNRLYNEIEIFCSQIMSSSMKSDKYIRNTVYKDLCKYAELQVEFYSRLRSYSEKYKLEPIKKASVGAYEHFDSFLKKYSGGEKSKFWCDLSTSRRDNNFN